MVVSSDIQSWDPKRYAENARYVAELGKPLLDLLALTTGERILDLGCGDGALTLELTRHGCEVVGVDSSEEMVAVARSVGIDARCMDGAALPFSNEFDAVFSNATLHWISPPDAVVAGVWRALKPGGRFVAEFGGSGNVAKIVSAIEQAVARRGVTVDCPWFFPASDEYAALLKSAGFSVNAIELFPRLTRLPGDVGGWLETFAQYYIQSIPETERATLISEIVEDLRGQITDGEGSWFGDYVRLRFRAEKPRTAA